MSSHPPADAELLRVIGAFYDAAIEPAGWAPALERLARLVDGCTAAIAFHSFTRPEFELSAKWNTNEAFERAMRENLVLNPLIPSALYDEPDQPFSAFRRIGEDELKAGRWYARTIGAFGYGDILLAMLMRSANRFVGLSMMRRAEQPHFDDRHIALIRPLCPHVRRAVMIADVLDARALERDTLAAALDLVNAGIVLTDGDGRIVHANAAAEDKFGAGPLAWDGGKLSARDAATAQELGRAIAAAATGTTIDIPRAGVSVTLAVPGGLDLAAWVLPLDSGLRRDFGAGFDAKVAVFVRELGDTSPFPVELFLRRYGITPAECRVLALVVQGMNPGETADALGLSLPTIKTHLARLFDKTGTRGQTDLVRLAMSALAPAGSP